MKNSVKFREMKIGKAFGDEANGSRKVANHPERGAGVNKNLARLFRNIWIRNSLFSELSGASTNSC